MIDEHDLSDEDLELWYYVSQDVEPLPGKELKVPETKTLQESVHHGEASKEDIEKLIEKTSFKRKKKADLGYIKHGMSAGVDKATARRITGGKFKIEAKLDLHGRTQDQALEDLRNFVKHSFDAGKRGVLVITGKGPDNEGVLKNQVPRWLNTPGIRDYVLMFSYAQAKHGGEGALYVLLKKKRI